MIKAKTATWKKIANIFNNTNNCERSVECLRTKWENLKKTTRKSSKDVFNMSQECDETTNKVLAMLYEAESNTYELPSDFIHKLDGNITLYI